MSMYTFGVITEVPGSDDYTSPINGGNLANAIIYRQVEGPSASNDWVGTYKPEFLLDLMTPVFALGEVLILNSGGREVGGCGRKPDKWFVTCEEFDDIEDAIARSREVLEEA